MVGGAHCPCDTGARARRAPPRRDREAGRRRSWFRSPRRGRSQERRGHSTVTVTVVADSAASLPPDLVDRWGIRVVPQHLVLGGEDHPDGALSPEHVVARAHDGVSTSAPSPGEFLAILEPLAADGAVVVTVASEMSGTYKSAWLAANTLDGAVRVVDSQTAAGAEGLVALSAARAAAGGASVEEVEAVANDVAGRVQLIATVPGLEHLVRSGRVP